MEKEKDSVSLYKWLRLLLAFLIFALVCAVIVMGVRLYHASHQKGPVIDASYIESKIAPAAKLTSAELQYRGLIKYEDGKIPFLSVKAFSMLYEARISAGIDMEKIKVEVFEDKVVVSLPKAELQSIEVDPDSIQFYDEKLALFNWTNKEDVVDAIKAARDDAMNSADIAALKKKAEEQATLLISELLSGATGDLLLEVK